MLAAELVGVAVAVAGFVPIGLNESATSEHDFSLFLSLFFSLFAIIALSLLILRVITVLFARLFGATVPSKSVATRSHRP